MHPPLHDSPDSPVLHAGSQITHQSQHQHRWASKPHLSASSATMRSMEASESLAARPYESVSAER